jgi:hypothetical protein
MLSMWFFEFIETGSDGGEAPSARAQIRSAVRAGHLGHPGPLHVLSQVDAAAEWGLCGRILDTRVSIWDATVSPCTIAPRRHREVTSRAMVRWSDGSEIIRSTQKSAYRKVSHMARQKLNRIIRKAVEDQLIDQAKLDAFVAKVARHPQAARLRWRRPRKRCYELDTPYGTLHVIGYFRGCWTAARDTALLIHAHNNNVAIFTELPEAKATALLHAAVGFGNRAPLDDGLIWCLD